MRKNPVLYGPDNPRWTGGKVTKICAYCGKEYKVNRSRLNRGFFCSKSCFYSGRGKVYGKGVGSQSVDVIHRGYLTRLCQDGVRRQVHRMIWEEAYGPMPEGFILHHEDENRLNNDLKNLQLMTRAEHNTHHWNVRKTNA